MSGNKKQFRDQIFGSWWGVFFHRWGGCDVSLLRGSHLEDESTVIKQDT